MNHLPAETGTGTCTERMFGLIFPLIKRKGWCVPVSGQHREYRYNRHRGTSCARGGRQTARKASYFTKDIFNTSIINLSFGIHSIFHFLTFLFWKWELLEQSCSPSPVTAGSCRMQREKWLVLIFLRQFAWKNQRWIFKRKGCLPGSSKLFAGALDFIGSEGQIWGWGVLEWLPHSLFPQHNKQHRGAENFRKNGGHFFPLNCLQGEGGEGGIKQKLNWIVKAASHYLKIIKSAGVP